MTVAAELTAISFGILRGDRENWQREGFSAGKHHHREAVAATRDQREAVSGQENPANAGIPISTDALTQNPRPRASAFQSLKTWIGSHRADIAPLRTAPINRP